MKTKPNNKVKNFYKASQELTAEFVKKYFNDHYTGDVYWIGDEVGTGVFALGGDYFFDMDQIVKALEIKPTYKRLMDAYYYGVETKKPLVNFENYLKYGNPKKK